MPLCSNQLQHCFQQNSSFRQIACFRHAHSKNNKRHWLAFLFEGLHLCTRYISVSGHIQNERIVHREINLRLIHWFCSQKMLSPSFPVCNRNCYTLPSNHLPIPEYRFCRRPSAQSIETDANPSRRRHTWEDVGEGESAHRGPGRLPPLSCCCLCSGGGRH